MKISDNDFLKFLFKFQNIRHYQLPKNSRYYFKLISAPNPTPRMQYSIEFYSDGWEKTHTCPAKLSMEFLDDFNSGLKERSDYRNKTGAKTLSRRGGYLLRILHDVEQNLDSDSKNNLQIKDKVLSVLQDKNDELFLREEIIDLIVYDYPDTNRSSVIPSDYCYNMINAGIPFDFHIFESIGKGQYKYLGVNFSYSGPIYWKREQVGKWEKGQYQLWKDPRKLK